MEKWRSAENETRQKAVPVPFPFAFPLCECGSFLVSVSVVGRVIIVMQAILFHYFVPTLLPPSPSPAPLASASSSSSSADDDDDDDST